MEKRKSKEVSFQIKKVSKVTGGFVLLCAITPENKEYYGSADRIQDGLAPFRFVGQRANILLRNHGMVTPSQLEKAVKAGKTTITFEAYEGHAGETFLDIKGNEKTYSKDGWNLLSGTFTLPAAAQNAIAIATERAEERLLDTVMLKEYEEMNGGAKASTSVSTATPVEADEPNV
jgi:hypothetical protein